MLLFAPLSIPFCGFFTCILVALPQVCGAHNAGAQLYLIVERKNLTTEEKTSLAIDRSRTQVLTN